MALRNLRMIAEQRPWTGKPSCTQLLKGTREVFLEITQDYFIDPQDAIFRIVGTKAHSELDRFTGDNEIGEIRLEIEGITGQFDYYENENIFDTKTYGSFAVSQCLGYKTVDTPTGEFYKTGAKKGQEKTRKEVVQGEPELTDQSLQLNLYRMMIEESGFPVKKMFLDIAVRDGNTYLAHQRGIIKNAYLIPVPHMSNDEVLAYFLPKRDALLWHLEAGTMPEPCTPEERWANASGIGNKCLKYCNVAEFCDIGREVKGSE
ncbi:MAG: hypothetical protein PHX61_12770 [Alphaproteobacteria bacterium]|nr:hypothetical protein [Alphaproteobacteria bacterium]